MKKSLNLTISMRDPDHHPPSDEKTISIETGAPWLTYGRILAAIQKIGEEEGCSVQIR